jgi:hypothetical protein
MNTKFFYKVEKYVEIIWQGKKKLKKSLFRKMRKVIKFYKAFYILGRLLNSRRKNNNQTCMYSRKATK